MKLQYNMKFRRVINLLYRLFFLFVLMSPVTAQSEISPHNLYGNKIEFDVIRDGQKVGQHTTRFQTKEDNLIVETQMNIKVKIFSIPIYTFNYESTEVWSDDILTNLDVLILDGTERKIINAFSTISGLSIQGPSGNAMFAGPIIPTNHWNVNVVKENQVLNTLTGEINQVQITNKGSQNISVKNGNLKAIRYDYTGDLKDTSVWYDDKGRWVKLQFIARDGSTISYICNTCEFK